MTYTTEQRRAAGRLGGRKTALKYGPTYMSLIGAAGFQATCERHFAGDSIACQAWLAKERGMPRLAANHGAGALLNARLEAQESGRFNHIRKEG